MNIFNHQNSPVHRIKVEIIAMIIEKVIKIHLNGIYSYLHKIERNCLNLFFTDNFLTGNNMRSLKFSNETFWISRLISFHLKSNSNIFRNILKQAT